MKKNCADQPLDEKQKPPSYGLTKEDRRFLKFSFFIKANDEEKLHLRRPQMNPEKEDVEIIISKKRFTTKQEAQAFAEKQNMPLAPIEDILFIAITTSGMVPFITKAITFSLLTKEKGILTWGNIDTETKPDVSVFMPWKQEQILEHYKKASSSTDYLVAMMDGEGLDEEIIQLSELEDPSCPAICSKNIFRG